MKIIKVIPIKDGQVKYQILCYGGKNELAIVTAGSLMEYDAGYEVAKTDKRPAVAKALKEMLQNPDLGGTVSSNATSFRESLDQIALKIASDQANISTTVSAEITKQVEKLKDSMPGITNSQFEKITQAVHDSLKIEYDMKFELYHKSLLRIEKMISTYEKSVNSLWCEIDSLKQEAKATKLVIHGVKEVSASQTVSSNLLNIMKKSWKLVTSA